MSKKILSVVLAVVLAFGVSVGVSAATPSVFDGYKVAVLDTVTPATGTQGRANDPNTMCFVSANGTELGSMAYSDYLAVSQSNGVKVQVPGAGTYNNPPNGYDNWEVWYADQFNAYRGLSADSREQAQAEQNTIDSANTAALVEQYRQEVVELVNAEREKVGLPALAVDDDAMAFAQVRANEIAEEYSHIRPNGERPMLNGIAVLENINRGPTTPQTAINSWMNSTGHKGNILSSDAYAVGVGVYQSSGGSWHWVQIFIW